MSALMYKTKVKKPYSGPPRPNLLSHEKVLKDTKVTMEQQSETIERLQRRVDELERKLTNQTAYLSAVHQSIQRRG
jgi:phage shock protein A